MEVKAKLNYLNIAPRKTRLAANLIKGMNVGSAEFQLRRLSKRAAAPLLKLLRSALANAKHNFQIDPAGMYIKEVRVDPGPVLKRFMPRAFGRASLIRKRTSHIALTLGVRVKTAVAAPRSGKEKPVVRELKELRPEEIKAESETKRRQKETGGPARRKTGLFARRMFRRKVV